VNDSSSFPRSWIWDDDGDEIVGRYRSFSQGHTKAGDVVPIAQLEVGGEARSIWLFHTSLREQFLAEVQTRPDKDLDPGETVHIRRLEERQSQSSPDRTYRVYRVEFQNKRRPSAIDLLSVSVPLGATAPPPPAGVDDGIQF
jgi:hypothetical protein